MTENQEGHPTFVTAGGLQNRGEGCGGPLGLGDPEDRYVRKAEMSNLVNKRVILTVNALCEHIHKDWRDCTSKHQISGFYTCRPQLKVSRDCYKKWMEDERIQEICLEDHIQERKNYRITGITVASSRQDRDRMLNERGVEVAKMVLEERGMSTKIIKEIKSESTKSIPEKKGES